MQANVNENHYQHRSHYGFWIESLQERNAKEDVNALLMSNGNALATELKLCNRVSVGQFGS